MVSLFLLVVITLGSRGYSPYGGENPSSRGLVSFKEDSISLFLTTSLRKGAFGTLLPLLRVKEPRELSDWELAALLFSLYNTRDQGLSLSRLMDEAERRWPFLEEWLLYLKFKHLLSSGEEEAARSMLENWTKEGNSPLLDEATRLLFARYLSLGDRESISELISERDIEKLSLPLSYIVARNNLLQGNRALAHSIFKRILKVNPESPLSFKILPYLEDEEALKGRILSLMGKGKQALKVLPYPTADPDLLFARALALFYSGRYADFLREFPRVEATLKREMPQVPDNLVRLYYLEGFARINRGDTSGAFLSWLEGALGEGRWSRKSAFMLSYHLFKMRFRKEGRRQLSGILQSLPKSPGPYLASRLAIVSIAYQRDKEAERFLRISMKKKGFLRSQSLFWLYLLTGEREYRTSLRKEFPWSYYTLTLEKRIPLQSDRIKKNIVLSREDRDMMNRFRMFAFLGLNRLAWQTISKREDLFSWALAFSDSVKNHPLAVRISRVMMRMGMPVRSEEAFPLFSLDYVKEKAVEKGLDPAIVLALMREESSFDPSAISPAWAWGLTQVVFPTAQSVREGYLSGPEELLDERTNLDIGLEYMRRMLDEFGSYHLALAAYNAGPGRAKRWEKTIGVKSVPLFVEFIPYEETRNYVRRTMRSYWIYRSILESLDSGQK